MNNFTPDFLIIPYELVKDDKLGALEHRVYAVIYWYEHLKEGRCIASNHEIARVARIGESTAANALTSLERGGYIKRYFDNTHRAHIETLVKFSRLISPTTEVGVLQPENRESKRVEESKTALTNTTSVNGIENAIKDCIALYQRLYKHQYGSLPQIPAYSATHVAFKRLLQRYSLVQLCIMIFLHFEWRGMTGESDSMWEKAKAAGFPLIWLYNNVGQYETFLMSDPEIKDIWSVEHEAELYTYLDKLLEELSNSEMDLPF